jgi:hypothetical protein
VKTKPLQPGQLVQFKLSDVHLPSLEDVLNRMTADTELRGVVTLLSDSGDRQPAYAVIEVKGILMPIIVPIGCLRSIAGIEKAVPLKTW